jgi:hypothetical protein
VLGASTRFEELWWAPSLDASANAGLSRLATQLGLKIDGVRSLQSSEMNIAASTNYNCWEMSLSKNAQEDSRLLG